MDLLAGLLAKLPPAPGIEHIDEDEDERENVGDLEAAIADGRAYRHELVGAWLAT